MTVCSNPSLCLCSLVSRHTSASSECLSREKEACCNYWGITLRPNTSFAAPSFLHTHSHTHSRHSTRSHNNSNTLTHTNTKSVRTGSRLQHLLRPRPILQILSQPENWQEPVGALCSIQPNRSHEQRREAPHLRDLWLQTCSCQWLQMPVFSTWPLSAGMLNFPSAVDLKMRKTLSPNQKYFTVGLKLTISLISDLPAHYLND